MLKKITTLPCNTVSELINVLKNYEGNKISIFGSFMPIQIFEENGHIILDETDLTID